MRTMSAFLTAICLLKDMLRRWKGRNNMTKSTRQGAQSFKKARRCLIDIQVCFTKAAHGNTQYEIVFIFPQILSPSKENIFANRRVKANFPLLGTGRGGRGGKEEVFVAGKGRISLSANGKTLFMHAKTVLIEKSHTGSGKDIKSGAGFPALV